MKSPGAAAIGFRIYDLRTIDGYFYILVKLLYWVPDQLLFAWLNTSKCSIKKSSCSKSVVAGF